MTLRLKKLIIIVMMVVTSFGAVGITTMLTIKPVMAVTDAVVVDWSQCPYCGWEADLYSDGTMYCPYCGYWSACWNCGYGAPTRDFQTIAQVTFRSEELLISHYNKHRAEFGNISLQEYLQGANDLISSSSTDILTKVRENGDVLYYNKASNEFAIKTIDGFLRTYFKPVEGLDYFNRQ